ncbi:Crp/Fnr family transcriptional regulator [Pleurocapsales cyanobacterium LEGE 10410]|nr:Crp/Fnr family transcriptional regulator [Pleurocapsales cyanobacterium LEGE 10410]
MDNRLLEFIEQYIPLTEEEKTVIDDLNIIRSFKKGTMIVEEGDIIRDAIFVLKGCLRSYYIWDGEEKTSAFTTENEPLILLTGDDPNKTAHYVDCVEDSIVTLGNLEMENETVKNFPRFEKLCKLISEQLLEKNASSFAEFKNASPEQRFKNLLKNRPDLLQRVPQHQIASFLGMKPQSLSRIRKRLSQKSSA